MLRATRQQDGRFGRPYHLSPPSTFGREGPRAKTSENPRATGLRPPPGHACHDQSAVSQRTIRSFTRTMHLTDVTSSLGKSAEPRYALTRSGRMPLLQTAETRATGRASLSIRTTAGCRTPKPGLTDWATEEVSCRDRITASSGDVVFLTTRGGNETLFEPLLACRSGEMQRDGWSCKQKRRCRGSRHGSCGSDGAVSEPLLQRG